MSSDTISQLNQFHTNSEAAMLSIFPFIIGSEKGNVTRTCKVILQIVHQTDWKEKQFSYMREGFSLVQNLSLATLTYLRQLTSEMLKAGCWSLLLITLCFLGFGEQ